MRKLLVDVIILLIRIFLLFVSCKLSILMFVIFVNLIFDDFDDFVVFIFVVNSSMFNEDFLKVYILE